MKQHSQIEESNNICWKITFKKLMSFYVNYCSPQYSGTDPKLQLFRQIIVSVIIFELFSAIVLRIVSGLKNYDLLLIKKQIQQQKKIQNQVILQTLQNLNHLTSHNQTNMTLINKTSSTINNKNILQKDPISIMQTIILAKQPIRKQAKRQKKQKKPQENSQQSQSSDQSQISEENDQQMSQSSGDLVQDHPQIFQQSKNFINIFNIKLNQAQASTFFNIIIGIILSLFLGHFFISATLSLQHSPSIYSAFFSGLHGISLFLLILVNSCVKSNSNRISDSEKTNENQEQANLGHSRNLSSNLMIDDKSDKKVDHQNEQNKKKQQKPLKTKISLLIMALMIMANLCLLAYSVVQIKQNYFNLKENRCQ